jgi:GPH family glycoside/pentoside/hexuronide:cation symporter
MAAFVTCVLFFLAATAFSVYSVPYLAIAAELSHDTNERNRIMVLRMVFATIGVLLGVGAAQPLVQYFGGGPHGWRAMSWVLGAVCLVTMLITAQSLRKTPLIPSDQPPGSLRGQIAQVRKNRPFVILLATNFISNVGQASSYTALGFVFIYVVKAVWLIPLFILAMSSAAILSQPLWLWLPRRIGKPRSYVLASTLWALVTITWLWVSPLSATMVQIPFGQPMLLDHVLVIARALAIGAVNGGFIMLALSMMTDTVDYQRRNMGVASEGVFAGLFSAFEKLAFAVGPVIAGVVLSLFGFVSSTGVEVPQTATAIGGIVLLYSVIPAAMQGIALLVFRKYKLPAG